jgi:hypothetical protein
MVQHNPTSEKTQVRAFKDDVPRISHCQKLLAERERANFNQEHVITRALDSLEAQLTQPTNPEADHNPNS